MELSEENAAEYLRSTGRVSPAGAGEILVQSLSGGIANIVLKVFDTQANGGAGKCLVLKQPLAKFRTESEWLVDVERVEVERDCIELLTTLLPAGSVPEVLWYDAENKVLAISCAPVGAVIWKKALLAGEASAEAAMHAGMLLAMLHSSTENDPAVAARYGDPKLFMQQRIDPYFYATGAKHPALDARLRGIGAALLGGAAGGMCLIHGDFSPKNIFLVPRPDGVLNELAGKPGVGGGAFEVERLMLLDFEVAFYGHPAFDVATLLNHFLLKGFYHSGRAGAAGWRAFMVLADNFWETYRHTASPDLVRAAEAKGGEVLGALLLARVDGKSPAEYLDAAAQARVRAAALAILAQKDRSLERALDVIPGYLES